MAADRVIAETQVPPAEGGGATGSLAALGAIAGMGGLAASSCCVLPLALAAMGAGSATLGGLEALALYRVHIIATAGVLLAGAWFTFWRRRATACAIDGACAKPATSLRTTITLALATKVVILAVVWDYVEPLLARAVQ
jgi:mercuric ion transport protein